MFKIGDRVQHQTTGITGKVIGYGYRQVNDRYYKTTIKVELLSYFPIKPIAEDLADRWIRQDAKILTLSLPKLKLLSH
ncbi:hypothetical protein I4641_14505 [Waterburya agarophytonicola K14]|uniref:Uncharacterized protein n=1 Tax=Waterburya agarophytonicola KI4 TaxID=2874699 RepID=A0A964BSV0_9CYAN|nr:hypothetical protein [Waterburya agarophytonicola]MCC0178191.1 hypothetical protein [Waterburya agarophytonicola KI4]